MKSSSKVILNDYLRGNLQWYIPCLETIKSRDENMK